MTEVWLQSNRRVLAMGLVPAVGLALLGGFAVALGDAMVLGLIGWGLIFIGGILTLGLLHQFRRPRVAYRDGNVLFNLRAGPPIAVPREVVEAFFIGQGPAYLPGAHRSDAETVNLVARLSQKAPEWAHVDVKPALGHWCDSYVTIRGTWCEPLNGEVIRRLNARLRELRTAEMSNEDETQNANANANGAGKVNGKSQEPLPQARGDA